MDRLISMKVCINTSTIRGRGLSLPVLASLVARAGWQGIEPWIAELEAVDKQPGGLEQLAQQLSDLGLEMPSAIGFSQWIVDDPAQRRAGLEDARPRREPYARLTGAELIVPNEEQRRDPVQLVELLRRQRVTHAFLPPALLNILPLDNPLGVTHLLTGGDACEPHVIERLAGRCQLHNLYGPTETTLAKHFKRIDSTVKQKVDKPITMIYMPTFYFGYKKVGSIM